MPSVEIGNPWSLAVKIGCGASRLFPRLFPFTVWADRHFGGGPFWLAANVAHRRSTVSNAVRPTKRGRVKILKANYDLFVTAFVAGVLLFIGAPLPLWAVWATVAVLQIFTRLGRGRRALDARRQAEMRADELDKRNGEAPPFK